MSPKAVAAPLNEIKNSSIVTKTIINHWMVWKRLERKMRRELRSRRMMGRENRGGGSDRKGKSSEWDKDELGGDGGIGTVGNRCDDWMAGGGTRGGQLFILHYAMNT